MTLLTATKGMFADLWSEYKDDEDVVDRKISCQREDVKEKLSFLSEEKYLTFLGRPTKIVPLHVSRNMRLNCDFSYCMKPLLRSEDFQARQNIKVSSEHKEFGDPRRVVYDGDPWCAYHGHHFGEWVQVDLGSMKLISGLLIEGWKWRRRKAPPNVEWTDRVTHYSVEFSPDGRLWTVIKDENGLPRKYTKNYGHRGLGSELKWCVDMTKPRDPPWLEFDLLYRRFISRVEVTIFYGKDEKYSYYLDARSVRFSLDKVMWNGLHVRLLENGQPISRQGRVKAYHCFKYSRTSR
ncbi:hypothetical protein OS493_027175 [Desmophyllum pertusum]|uniref:F5/8 type C domain-containing protein n=1 Tax=Desmophyllum pertusum TaxID=174260 RepID=A0A9W9ZYL0_9CNID|nr:hypothetical protein OS493_027175 [Desmophyllum pertusum]